MILGFKKQFEPLIKCGDKIHTIREDKSDRWAAGKKIHFATGVRTKNYSCFGELSCYSVQSIEIKWNLSKGLYKTVDVFIDSVIVGSVIYDTDFSRPQVHDRDRMIHLLAENDGFSTVSEFFEWFNSDFKGKIIHWTSHKYQV